MQLDEQEIQFKKRARRRLVGAIALVLLMVTILPMVLDDRSATLSQQEITISIPSQDGDDFTSDITPYIPENQPSDEEMPVLDELNNLQDPATASATTEPVAPVVEPSTKAAESVKQVVEPVKAVEKPVAGPTYSVQIGVFSDAANVKQLEQKLQTLGFKSSTEKIQTAQGEKIRLRAGPFANRALAEGALAKIKDAGLSGMIITNK
jgi:DedD protein